MLAILLASCMQEPEPEIGPIGTQRNVITALQAPKITTTLSEKLGIGVRMAEYSAYTDQESSLVLDLNDIHQIVDTLGNETYTIRVLNEMPDPKVFYNLVLKYTPEGDAERPFLIRYEMGESTYDEYLRTGDLTDYSGSIQKYFIGNVGIEIPRSISSDGGFEGGGLEKELPGVTADPCDEALVGNDDPADTEPDELPDYGMTCKKYLKTYTYYNEVCSGGTCERTIVYQKLTIVTECEENNGDGATSSDIIYDDCEETTEEIPVLPQDLCKTNDEVLNNSDIQSFLDNLWTNSHVDRPIEERLEQGGWITRAQDGTFGFVDVSDEWITTSCGMAPPSNWLEQIPPNVVGFVHTHPFMRKEDTRSVCGKGGSRKYKSGSSEEDYQMLLAAVAHTNNITLKSYVLDGSKISKIDFAKNLIKYNRCGY